MTKMGHAGKRHFNGERYHNAGWHMKKSDAKASANGFRKNNAKARVVRGSNSSGVKGWDVYVRAK
jgi:hypothetical protein